MNSIAIRFHRWTVIGFASDYRSPSGRTKVHRLKCQCDCGTVRDVRTDYLWSGRSKSCGCLRRETHTKHGMAQTKMYGVWHSMLQRCYNKNDASYEDYGGRGIRVCKRWRQSFVDFMLDMGPKPNSRSSIDRIDNDGNYCPENCRWASTKQQATNKRRRSDAVLITCKGETHTIQEWAKRLNVKTRCLQSRYYRGWDSQRIVTEPTRKRQLK
jgi:hypothetical protein